MSIKQAKAFIEMVQNDEDLQYKLSKVQDNESKLEIAKELGFEVTKGDIVQCVEELTEAELVNVVGGKTEVTCFTPLYFYRFDGQLNCG